MKAITDKKGTYEITGEKGDFFVCKDNKGKVRMFAKKNVKVIEIESMPKAKKYRGYVAPKSEKAIANAKRRYEEFQSDMEECKRLDTQF